MPARRRQATVAPVHYVPPQHMTPTVGARGGLWWRVVVAQGGWCWCAGGCGRSHTPQRRCERHNKQHPHGQPSGHCGGRLDNGRRLFVRLVDGVHVATCAPCTDGLARVAARAAKVAPKNGDGPDLLDVLMGNDQTCDVCGEAGADRVQVGTGTAIYCPGCAEDARQLIAELQGGTWEA